MPGWVLGNPAGIRFSIWGFNLFAITDNLIPAAFPQLDILCQKGDMIILLTEVAFGFTFMIRIRCQNVAYGTFLNSFVSDLITIDTIRYIVPIANVNQFINPLIFGMQTLFGKLSSDSIDPRNYITSKDFQQQIADIPVNLPIDKNILLAFQLDVFCQHLSMILFVQKIEALTHK